MPFPAAAPGLRPLRLAATIEGATLLLLLTVAVPLKHLASLPQAVSMVGPVHGLAFLAYLWLLLNAAASQRWDKGLVARMVVAAFIPFGTFMAARFLARCAWADVGTAATDEAA